jgi:hypothetical protein
MCSSLRQKTKFYTRTEQQRQRVVIVRLTYLRRRRKKYNYELKVASINRIYYRLTFLVNVD